MPAPKYIAEGSPLAAFVFTLQNIITARNLINLGPTFGAAKWTVFIQDVQMLLEEGVTFGCRTPWVRRVAVPVVMAQRVLDRDNDDELTRAKAAHEILGQLQNADDALMAACRGWVEERFLKPKEPAA